MLVIGTAGHIDHGKSSIIKRLTNTDPDRLPEEKARGMTIDLGFAFYQTPENETIAFVDVPGHERFVKNMVAGVGSIDAVMLVIAADDGWMPQSEEHFQIVRLLKVKQGIIVINKIDLADAEWLDLLESEIKEKTVGSFLEAAPLFKVSAQTGEGFDKLQAFLNKLPHEISSQLNINKPRLYIDRSFVRPGIGGVVTGTLKGGEISVGDTITIFPSQKEAKIRSLHSNNQAVETAIPGQRTAISFTGIDKEHLSRGAVVLKNEEISQITDNPVLVLSIEMLPNSPVNIEDRRRILMIVGTTEVEGEIRIYDKQRINPGDKSLIYFKPDEPVYALIGEKWIGRLPTPMVTIGGGQVLDYLKHFPRKKDIEKYAYLQNRVEFTLTNVIMSEIEKELILPQEKILANIDFSQKAVNNQVKTLWQKKEILIFEGHIYRPDILEKAVKLILKQILEFLENKAHLNGIMFEQIVEVTGLTPVRTETIVKYLLSTGSLIKTRDKYSLSGSDVTLKGALKNTYEIIMKELSDNRYTPPTINNLIHTGKQARNAIRFILDTSQAYKCGPDFIFLREAWEEIISFIKETLDKKNELTVADLKEKFELSRKFTIPILEETDRLKITERKGDVRVKGANFES